MRTSRRVVWGIPDQSIRRDGVADVCPRLLLVDPRLDESHVKIIAPKVWQQRTQAISWIVPFVGCTGSNRGTWV